MTQKILKKYKKVFAICVKMVYNRIIYYGVALFFDKIRLCPMIGSKLVFLKYT